MQFLQFCWEFSCHILILIQLWVFYVFSLGKLIDNAEVRRMCRWVHDITGRMTSVRDVRRSRK